MPPKMTAKLTRPTGLRWRWVSDGLALSTCGKFGIGEFAGSWLLFSRGPEGPTQIGAASDSPAELMTRAESARWGWWDEQ